MAKVNPIQLQKHLKGMNYPASKKALIEHAKKHGADENVNSVLEQIPDEEYETPAEVSKAVGAVVQFYLIQKDEVSTSRVNGLEIVSSVVLLGVDTSSLCIIVGRIIKSPANQVLRLVFMGFTPTKVICKRSIVNLCV